MIHKLLKPYSLTRLIENILTHYGRENQRVVIMEEFAELIQAIAKDIRADDPAAEIGRNEARIAVVEEYADCLIMLCQLESIYQITRAETLEILANKIKRQTERIEKEKTREWKNAGN